MISDKVNHLTRDELLEEHLLLLEKCQELRSTKEKDDQRIYELKRALNTAEAAQTYLSQELEQLSKQESNQQDEELIEQKNKTEEWCKKSHRLEEDINNLQLELDNVQQENTQLRQQLDTALKQNIRAEKVNEQQISAKHSARIQEMEDENYTLLQKIEESHQINTQKTLIIAEQEKNLEILRDEVNCLKENLQHKREEIEEKTQLLESTQEKLMEANGLVNKLSSAPDQNSDRKGNSLFAEVDDQRQAMKQVLMVQKKSYMEMKKIYTESEYEIRRLKRENKSFHTELEACISIFCNADKTYCNRLNERIYRLMKENESLEQKLTWTQERLKSFAQEKDMNWLNSMLDFCNKETANYKQQLQSVRLQNASLEQSLRKVQQEIARWRFESLKSRVVLANYEQLLKEHKISFKPIQSFEYKVTEEDIKTTTPRLISHNNIKDTLLTTNRLPIEGKSLLNSPSDPLPVIETEIQDGDKQIETPPNIIKNSENTNMPNVKDDLENIENENNEKENKSDSHLLADESFEMIERFSKLKVKKCSPMRPSQRTLLTKKIDADNCKSSILKEDDPFKQQTSKTVSFSPTKNEVHIFEPELKNDISAKPPKTETIVIKNTTSQSNIVIKRMVIQKSKNK